MLRLHHHLWKPVIIPTTIIVTTIIVIIIIIIVEKLFIGVLTVVLRLLAGGPHLMRGGDGRGNQRARPIQGGGIDIQQVVQVFTGQGRLGPDNALGFGLARLVSIVFGFDLQRSKLIVRESVRPVEATMLVYIVGGAGHVPAVRLIVVVRGLLGVDHAVTLQVLEIMLGVGGSTGEPIASAPVMCGRGGLLASRLVLQAVPIRLRDLLGPLLALLGLLLAQQRGHQRPLPHRFQGDIPLQALITESRLIGAVSALLSQRILEILVPLFIEEVVAFVPQVAGAPLKDIVLHEMGHLGRVRGGLDLVVFVG